MATNYFSQLGFDRGGEQFMRAAQGAQGLRANEQAMQMNEQNMQRQQSTDQQAMLQFQNEQQKQKAAQGAGAFYNALNSGNDQAALQIAQQYQDDINSLGDPTFTVDSVAQLMQTPEGKQQLKQMSLGMVQMAAGPEALARYTAQQAKPERAAADPAKVLEFRKWMELNPGATPEEKRKIFSQMVVPQERAFATGIGAGGARVITEQGLTPELVSRTGQQEAAKLAAQESVKAEQKQKANASAFNTYNTAISRLSEAAQNANTGPGMALIPAIASDDRIFEGAVATIAPVLKEVFRQAGEGVFTDKDQELLLRMAPNRNDSKEVASAKIDMVDSVVRAKLGQEQQAAPTPTGKDAFFGGAASASQQPVQPAQSVGGYKIIEVR